MERNNTIDVWRIVFTYMIVFFHFDTTFPYTARLNLTAGWYIAVEFFFIVSGYLLYQKAVAADKAVSPWEYTLHRYRQIYPRYLISLLILFGVIVWARRLNFTDSVDLLLDSYWELLGLQGIGLDRGWNYLNPVGWYISVMFISGFILWFFLQKHREIFLNLIAPVFVMIAFSNLYRISGTKNAAVDIEGFYINYALLKGMGNMCLGIFAARLNQRMAGKYPEEKQRTRLQILGAAGFAAVILLSSFRGNSTLDCLMSLILMVSVCLSFLPVSHRGINGAFVRKWSKITLNIYLLHEIFRTWIFPMLFPGKHSLPETLLLMGLYAAVVTAAAVGFEVLFGFIKRKKRNDQCKA